MAHNQVPLRTPYPHHTWFAHWLSIRPPRVFDVYECRHVTHRIVLTTHGEADILWATKGTETAFHAAAGDLSFFPCDRERHAMSITAPDGYGAYVVLVPDEQVCRVCTTEGVAPAGGGEAIPTFRDAVMQASLVRLSTTTAGRQISEDIGDEIAARQVLLRLSAILGGSPPDWRKDTSVFTPCAMRQIVERMDAQLGTHVSLETMAQIVGLSPGHFARKFQRSAGLSLNRFLNRRRIGASFAMLRDGSMPLARIALDLGFSSQSHFTRLFSGQTGITPHHYRRGDVYDRTPADSPFGRPE